MMSKLWNWLKNRWAEKGTKAAIGSIIAGAAAHFGFDLTLEQQLGIVTVLGIFVSGVAGATKTAKPGDPEKIDPL